MSITSSISENEREFLLDLLASTKTNTEICSELKISKNKLSKKINQIALKLYNEDCELDHIIHVTRITESKFKRLLDEQALRNNYIRNTTMTNMLIEIDKKQKEILELQQRLIHMHNDSWRF